MIAIASIFPVQQHSIVSSWFPILLLIYPVCKTVFSIYRKLARSVSPGVADALDFHQLIYWRIVRGMVHDEMSRWMLMCKNRTLPKTKIFTPLTVMPAVLFCQITTVLNGFCSFLFLLLSWFILRVSGSKYRIGYGVHNQCFSE